MKGETMTEQNANCLRSALFVDFDNIYSGLERGSDEAAERFARSPQRWLDWLEREVETRYSSHPGSTCRRILVRRCYLNPRRFNRFRPYFIRSGFEVVDCPPLTQQGKTSADILIVLDLVDALNHTTRFDELIVFSADADFTPVLLRVREHDRRSLVLTVGPAASAYKAACDRLVEEEAFIEQGLGMTYTPAVPAAGDAAAPIELMRRIAARVHDVAAVEGAIEAAQLPGLYKEFQEFAEGENWLGFYSLRRMTEAVVAIRDDLELAGDDAWRVEVTARTAVDSPAAATAGDQGEPLTDDELARVRERVEAWVRESAAPLTLGGLAHKVVDELGERIKQGGWQGSGSFKAFLERLGLDGLRISTEIPGHVYDPEIHRDFEPGEQRDELADEDPGLAELARSISNLTDTPYLPPGHYAVLLREVAKEVNENGFQLTRTSKAVRDRCNGKGIPVARSHVSFLLKGLSFSGYRFEPGAEVPALIGDRLVDNTLELARRAQLELDAGDEELVEDWILGGLDDEEMAALERPPAEPVDGDGVG